MALFNAKQSKSGQCSFCGREFPNVLKLADGAICDECATVKGVDWKRNIFNLDRNKPAKKITCNEVRQALRDWEEKKQMLLNLSVTRTSESGIIMVDDNQKVFFAKGWREPVILHRICDIRDFYLEYDYEEKGIHRKDGSTFSVKSGHITINLNEFNDLEEIRTHVDKKTFTQRGEVKKVFESDLVFLEEITGKKRKPIPNKIKLL